MSDNSDLTSGDIEVFYHYDASDDRLSAEEAAQIFKLSNVKGYGFPNDQTLNIYFKEFGGFTRYPAFIGGYRVNPVCASCIGT